MTEGMREPSKSIWYQLGYALESARHGSQSAREARSASKAQPEGNGTSTAPARSTGKARGEGRLATGGCCWQYSRRSSSESG